MIHCLFDAVQCRGMVVWALYVSVDMGTVHGKYGKVWTCYFLLFKRKATVSVCNYNVHECMRGGGRVLMWSNFPIR